MWPPGVGQEQDAGDFIKSLAGGVVTRLTQQLKLPMAGHVDEVRMAARDDEATEGQGGWLGQEKVGVDMGLQMVHGHQGEPEGIAQPLGVAKPHQ